MAENERNADAPEDNEPAGDIRSIVVRIEGRQRRSGEPCDHVLAFAAVTIPGEVAAAEPIQAILQEVAQALVVPIAWSAKGTNPPRIARATRMPGGNGR